MKKLMKFAALCFAALAVVSCDDEPANVDGPDVPDVPAPTKTLELSVRNVTDSSATVVATPSDVSVNYYVGLIASAEVGTKTADDLVAEAVAMENFATSLRVGQASVNYTDLTTETAYTIYAFVYDTETTKTGPVALSAFSTYATFGFEAEVSEISAIHAVVTISPEDETADYYASVRPTAELEGKDSSDIITELMTENNYQRHLYIGEQTISLAGLVEPDTDYTVVVFPYFVEGNTTGALNTEHTFKTDASLGDFTIEAAEILGTYAEFNVTAPNSTMDWYFCTLDKAKFNTETANYGNILGYDIDWWSFCGSIYGETWDEFIAYGSTHTNGSPKICSASPYYETPLRWGTDHVFYCYGIDHKTGKFTTEIFTHEFTTAMPTPSDNQITVTINEVYHDGIDATFTTTNNDPYFLIFQPKAAMANVDLSTPEAKDDYIFKLIYSYRGAVPPYKNGDYHMEYGKDNYWMFSDAVADTDMCLIVFGFDFDYGPTTEMQILEFHTLEKPAEEE